MTLDVLVLVNELLRTLNVPAVGAGAGSAAGQATEKR